MFICHFPHRKQPPQKNPKHQIDSQRWTLVIIQILYTKCVVSYGKQDITHGGVKYIKKNSTAKNEFSIARSEVICNNIKRGGICHFLFRIFDNIVSVENAPNKRNRYTWWMMIPLIGSMTLQWASHLSAEYSQLRDRSHIVSGLDLKNNTINISNNLNLTTLYSQERPYNFFKNCKSIKMTYERRNASLKI